MQSVVGKSHPLTVVKEEGRCSLSEKPQYSFFPHTPWIRQQHVTQWLSTWLYHGCVFVCVCVPRNPFESAPTARFNNPKVCVCVCVCVCVYVDVCAAALHDFCTHIATKICAHKPNTMFVLGCVCLLRNMVQFLWGEVKKVEKKGNLQNQKKMHRWRQKHCVAHCPSIPPTMQAPCNWALCVLPDPLHDRVPISIMWLFRFACCNIPRFESFRVLSCLACCHPSSYGFLAFPTWEAAGGFLRLLRTGCFLAGLSLSLSLSLPSEAGLAWCPSLQVPSFWLGLCRYRWYCC